MQLTHVVGARYSPIDRPDAVGKFYDRLGAVAWNVQPLRTTPDAKELVAENGARSGVPHLAAIQLEFRDVPCVFWR